jgi:hypothetical protein
VSIREYLQGCDQVAIILGDVFDNQMTVRPPLVGREIFLPSSDPVWTCFYSKHQVASQIEPSPTATNRSVVRRNATLICFWNRKQHPWSSRDSALFLTFLHPEDPRGVLVVSRIQSPCMYEIAKLGELPDLTNRLNFSTPLQYTNVCIRCRAEAQVMFRAAKASQSNSIFSW